MTKKRNDRKSSMFLNYHFVHILTVLRCSHQKSYNICKYDEQRQEDQSSSVPGNLAPEGK